MWQIFVDNFRSKIVMSQLWVKQPSAKCKQLNYYKMKKLIGSIICFFTGRHKYIVKEEFKRIGTNEYYKMYVCERCGHIHHEITRKINP